ncbi:hypothetical protein REPUB_Repub20aG0087400 [Reevesia pubescens]
MKMLDNIKAFFLSILAFIREKPRISEPPPALPVQPTAASSYDIEAVIELSQQVAATRNQESQLLTTFVALQQDLQWQNAILTFCFTLAIEVSLHQQQSSQTNHESNYSSIFISFAILSTIVLLLVIKLMDGRFTKILQPLEKVAILIATAAFCYIIVIPFPNGLKYTIWAILAICLPIVVFHKFIYGIGKPAALWSIRSSN